MSKPIDAVLLVDADHFNFNFIMEEEFASVEIEAELPDIEGTLESSTCDVFQDNFPGDVVQGCLPEKTRTV